jgi:hypothetical protein
MRASTLLPLQQQQQSTAVLSRPLHAVAADPPFTVLFVMCPGAAAAAAQLRKEFEQELKKLQETEAQQRGKR